MCYGNWEMRKSCPEETALSVSISRTCKSRQGMLGRESSADKTTQSNHGGQTEWDFCRKHHCFAITIMWSKKMHQQWVWGRCTRWGYQGTRSFKLCRRKWETPEEFKQQYVICMCRCMLLINKRSPEGDSVSNVFGFDLLNTQLTVAQANKGRHLSCSKSKERRSLPQFRKPTVQSTFLLLIPVALPNGFLKAITTGGSFEVRERGQGCLL